jgi:hypothetical protein
MIPIAMKLVSLQGQANDCRFYNPRRRHSHLGYINPIELRSHTAVTPA